MSDEKAWAEVYSRHSKLEQIAKSAKVLIRLGDDPPVITSIKPA